MVVVRELLSLNKLRNFKIIAGEDGLDNVITNIVIYEYDKEKKESDNFYRGDFIVSTLIYAKDNPELVETTLLSLLNQDIVGIAIKSAHFKMLPESIIRIANHKKIPVFLFDDTYMEDIIICVSNYIIQRNNQYNHQVEIDNILNNILTLQEIKQISQNINPIPQKYISAIYIAPQKPENEKDIYTIIQSVSYYNKNFMKQFVFVRYKNGLFIIGNFQIQMNKNELGANDIKELFQKLFIISEFSYTRFIIGQSEVFDKAEKFVDCISQSYYAYHVGVIESKEWVNYIDTGIYIFTFPLLKNDGVMEYYKIAIKNIKDYDEENNSYLMNTLIIYVKNNFEVSKTAKELYQHPNTIRYRINKVKTIIHYKEEYYEHFILMLITIYKIITSIES